MKHIQTTIKDKGIKPTYQRLKILEYLIEIKKCIVCNSEDISSDFQCKDYFLSQEFFHIYKCNNCGFKFTNPLPDEDNIEKYYESQEYLSHSQNKKGLFNYLYFKVREFKIKSKYRVLKKYSNGNRVLDVGCGTGEFLSYLKKKNYDVTGLEPNIKARDFAINTYNLNVYNCNFIENFPENSFNSITLWHVLEHIYNINGFLTETARILSDKGTLIIAVPNENCYDCKHYEKFWAAYDVPRHLYHFNQNTIKNLLKIYNFKLTKKIPMLFDSFYVSLLSEKYKTGKMNYLKGFFVGLYSNIYAFFNKKNYSSQVFVFTN